MNRVRSEVKFAGLSSFSTSKTAPSNPPQLTSPHNLNNEQLYTSPELLNSIRQLIHKTKATTKIYDSLQNTGKHQRNFETQTKRSVYFEQSIPRRPYSSNQKTMTSFWDTNSMKSSGFYCVEPVQKKSPPHGNKRKTYIVCDRSTTKPLTPVECLRTSISHPLMQSDHITQMNSPQIVCPQIIAKMIMTDSVQNFQIQGVSRLQYEECLIKRNQIENNYRELKNKFQKMKSEQIYQNNRKEDELEILRKRNIDLHQTVALYQARDRILQDQISQIVSEQVDKFRSNTMRQAGELFYKDKSRLLHMISPRNG